MTSTEAGRVAARGRIAPFHTMRVFDAAAVRRAAGLPVFDLSAGQPSTPAPRAVLEAARRALGEQGIGYTSSSGLLAVREAVAAHYARRYGLDVPASSVIMTTGSSGGFVAAFLAAFDPGDAVVVTVPGYPAYRNVLAGLGCRVVPLRCGAEDRFQPTVAALDALPERPAGLVLASPANPTGTMVDAPRLAAIVQWCRDHNVRLISDEIYHGLTYTGRGECAWQFDRDAIVANSFSKYFSMTGWRLGWLLVPDELVAAVDGLVGNLALCPPTLSQHAALAAFDAGDELDANVRRYRANRALMLDRLPAAGLPDLSPADGAFYVYADVSRYTHDSLAWVHEVLAATGVAMAPGVDFDPEDGGHHVRLSFAGDSDTISGAIDRLAAYLT